MSYIATANTIKYTGAKPVFAEVSKHSYNLDLDDVIKRITPKTKAIVLVHQMGKPAEIEDFQKLCTEQNLLLIEDAACAIGSEYKGKKIGSHSNFVCFSFHPRKIITTGEGGMICTNDDEIAKKLRLYRQHGMSINDRVRHEAKSILKEDHLVVGYNYRLTDIQAAIGIEQLKRIEEIVLLRRNIALKYNDAFSKIPFVKIPHENSNGKNNFQTYSLYLEDKDIQFRDKLMRDLLREGIATRRGIMTAHRETAYASKVKISLPITEDLSDKSICIPLFPELEKKQIQKIINSVSELLQK
jgi:dTDP-4-amino-4,6-dideoxygalactose transaminase